jgi:type IX secretion system PorP/SprF family membrane protein
MKKIFLFSLLLLFFVDVKSQDPNFAMINQNYSYVNPAFTGAAKNFRANLAYRNQWTNSPNSFQTTNLTIDQHLGKVGGVGVMALHDIATDGISISNLIAINYAKQIKIRQNGVLSLAVSGSWYQEKVDFSKLTFGSILTPRRGFIYIPSQSKSSASGFDLGLGAVYYTNKFYIGYGVQHLQEPNISVIEGVSPLPRKHSVQMGYKQGVNQNVSLLPTFYGTLQQDFLVLTAMLQLNWKWIIVGGGISSSENGLGVLGINFGEWRLLYSYDETVSKLTNQSEGSHEITLQTTFRLTKNENERPFLVY